MKTCNRCQQHKPLAAFHLHPQMSDGHLNQCRDCRNAWMSQYRKNKSSEMDWLTAQRKLRGSSPESDRRRYKKRNFREKTQRCRCCRDRDFKVARRIAKSMGCELDHVIPLAKGGINCLHNVQFVTREYNRAKADKLNFESPQVRAAA